MEEKIMKKILFIISLLTCSLFEMSAQSNDNDARYGSYEFRVGDTVMIRRSTPRYQTSEMIPEWVYYGRYSIQQVYSKYHPQSVLLKEIYSWVSVDTLMLVTTLEMTPEANQRIVDDRHLVEERYRTLAAMDKLKRDSIIYGLKRNNYPFILPETYFASTKAHSTFASSPESVSGISVSRTTGVTKSESHVLGTPNGNASYHFSVGDTVLILTNTSQYQTIEAIPEWVRYGRYCIQQTDSKNHPNAVLLKGINSWVSIDSLLLYSAAVPTPESAQRINDDSPYVLNRYETLDAMNKDDKNVITSSLDRNHYSYTLSAEYLASLGRQPVAPSPIDSVVEPIVEPIVEPVPVAPVVVVTNPEPIVTAPSVDTVSSQPIVQIAEAKQKPIQEVEPQPEEQLAQQVQVSSPEAKRCSKGYDRFTMGLRGGAASLLHHTTNNLGKWKCGYDVMLDLQYAHLWKNSHKHNLGLLVGLGVGYVNSSLQSQVNDQYTLSTSAGNIQYTITADQVNEKDGEVVIEVPIMFSMILRNGFFLNAGPRLSMPVYSHYNQTLVNPNVNAYFEKYGVDVPNEVVTGMVTDGQCKTKGRWSAPAINVMLSTELGYEWTFANRQSLSLGAYANYSVYTLYSNKTDLKSLVQVGAPGNNQAAQVSIFSATDAYVNSMGFFDVGLKIAYHFNFFHSPRE